MWQIESNLPVKLGVITVNSLQITTENTAYSQLFSTAKQYKEQYENTPISQINGVQYAREFFRAIKLDPTKRRPSSEALLNRAIKNKELYSINTLVDTGNWCSLDFLLPICVYDADKIEGDITFRMGLEGESYFGHNNNEVHLYDRFCVADNQGPFGSPITDSKRTAVDVQTQNALLLIFAPTSLPDSQLETYNKTFLERVSNICGGTVQETQIIQG